MNEAQWAITADISPTFITINGFRFSHGCALDSFRPAIGEPSRSFAAGPPAPYGHRNNQVHIFDALGIYLIEHHERRTIDGITFVLDLDHATFRPDRPFTGLLSIARYHLDPTFEVKDYLSNSPLPFTESLGWYFYKGERITIGLATFSRSRTKQRRRSRIRGIGSVSGDFLFHAHTGPANEQSSIVRTPPHNEPRTIEEDISDLATGIVTRNDLFHRK